MECAALRAQLRLCNLTFGWMRDDHGRRERRAVGGCLASRRLQGRWALKVDESTVTADACLLEPPLVAWRASASSQLRCKPATEVQA